MSRALCISLLLACTACNGSIFNAPNGPMGDDGGVDAGPVIPPVRPTCDDPPCVSASQMPLLTRVEYINSIAELFPHLTPSLADLPEDFFQGDYESNAGVAVEDGTVDTYQRAAEQLSVSATEDLELLLGCEPDDACARAWIGEFLRVAHRGPVSDDQRDAYTMLFDLGTDIGNGAALVIEAALQSPRFLYRIEPRADAGDHLLEPHELAGRLAFFLWRRTPSADLLDAAASGELDTTEGIAAMARTMLDDPRADPSLESFHAQWLGLDHLDGVERDAEVFEEFSAELVDDLIQETMLFTQALYRDDTATYATLIGADFSYLNPRLARFYGVPEPADGFQRVLLPLDERRGVLTQASVLTAHSKEDPGARDQPIDTRPTLGANSPVHRGLLVRRRFLCQTLPEPPEDAPLNQPSTEAGQSSREVLEERTGAGVCNSCHSQINPAGFAFQHYDALGRFRDNDGGQPVDASGALVHLDDFGEEFDDAFDLIDILATRADARYCMVRQWFRYAMGRKEASIDEPGLADVYDAFKERDNLRDLVVTLTTTDAFRHRRVE